MKHPRVDDKDDDDLVDANVYLSGTLIFDEEIHSCGSDNDGGHVSSQPSPSMDYCSLSGGISELGLSGDETPLDILSDSENDILSSRMSPLNVVESDEGSHGINYFGACSDDDMTCGFWDHTSHTSPTPSQLLDADICLHIASPRLSTDPGLNLSNKNTCEPSRDIELGDEITPHDLPIPEVLSDSDLFDEASLASPTDIASTTLSYISSPSSPGSHSQYLESVYQEDPSFDDDFTYNGTASNRFYMVND
ncbi:hypothetical protein CPB83DRAFT_844405 [Crepidotus variabilis]|uniref:Uncharacterized protein n=1 Tax=Crepidotus variabilis TaxID=179855 RepID=A0A9P6ESD4_9AGAR|nr:hypothetical protein CPB83DRAFT_844405 [Crepidotus variabilis]